MPVRWEDAAAQGQGGWHCGDGGRREALAPGGYKTLITQHNVEKCPGNAEHLVCFFWRQMLPEGNSLSWALSDKKDFYQVERDLL